MKVVALKSFFGSGVNAKSGRTLEVSDALGKAWIKAGLVKKADASDTSPAKATTPSTPAPAPTASQEPKSDETETTGEVVANAESGDQTNGEADKEPTTGDEVKTDDEPQAPATEPQAPVAPQNNSNQNTKKGK